MTPFKTFGGGLLGLGVALLVYVVLWASSGKSRLAFAFWTSWYFWAISYLSALVLAIQTSSRIKKQTVLGNDLISRFKNCSNENALDAKIGIRVIYSIGLSPHWDREEIQYSIENVGEKPIERKLFFIGDTSDSKKPRSRAARH